MVFLISFLVLSCAKNVNENPNNAVAEIKIVLQQQQNDWNSGSIDSFMNGYWKSDSLSFIGSSGIKYGWENTRNAYINKYPDKVTMGVLSFDILKTDIIGTSNALSTGKFTLERKSGQVSGYFTLLWKKINQKWVIVSDHTCG
jgi:hypothetical protein